jgi:hypothetical protein
LYAEEVEQQETSFNEVPIARFSQEDPEYKLEMAHGYVKKGKKPKYVDLIH